MWSSGVKDFHPSGDGPRIGPHDGPGTGGARTVDVRLTGMSELTTWEYATVPLLTHATKQILDQWGADGWELVSVLPGPTGEQHVAYLKRTTG